MTISVIGTPQTFKEALTLATNPNLPPFEFEKWFGLTFNPNMVLSGGKTYLDMWFNDEQGKKIMVIVTKEKHPPINRVCDFENKIKEANADAGVILSLYGAPYIEILCRQTESVPIRFLSFEQLKELQRR